MKNDIIQLMNSYIVFQPDELRWVISSNEFFCKKIILCLHLSPRQRFWIFSVDCQDDLYCY